MIRKLRLRNFKAFQDTGYIELRPITVLAGPNSGGKSTILQSLLLLKQTLESGSPDLELNLDGRFLQFSGLDELTFGKPPLEECSVAYEIEFESRMPRGAVPGYYPDLLVPEGVESIPLHSRLELIFGSGKTEGGKPTVMVRRFDMTSWAQDQDTPRPRLSITATDDGYSVTMEDVDLPGPFVGREFEGWAARNFLPTYLFVRAAVDEESERPSAVEVDPIFRFPLSHLEDYLRRGVTYLGPLRQEPRRAYPHSGSPFPEIGDRGEAAPQMLWLERDESVRYRQRAGDEYREVTLLDAVRDAFELLGITQAIDVKSVEGVVYQILFGLKGWGDEKHVTIADVGFGVSQLLPIVVMSLRSSDSPLLLFEQPEIHLHPRAQAGLADFFLSLDLSERRLVVETHSDHFINRLRRRIAEDPTDQLREDVGILFVLPPQDGRGATVEQLRVDRYGVIENWPAEFLPESADEAEAIFRAGLEKRGVR